jgi:membrane protein YdbS with pleckstrin-like domain
MKKKQFMRISIGFIVNFIVIFISAIVVKLLWNYFFHDLTDPEWAESAVLAAVIAISFTIIELRKKNSG